MYITFPLQVLFKTVKKTSKKCLKFMILFTSRFCDPYQDKFRAVEEKISYRTCNSLNFNDSREFILGSVTKPIYLQILIKTNLVRLWRK